MFGEVQTIVSLAGVSEKPAPVQDRDTGTIWLPFCRNLRDQPDATRGDVALIREGDSARRKRRGCTWYATRPGHSIQLASGRLLVACDHAEGGDDYSHVIDSDDHAASWRIGGSTDPDANECTALESADRRLCLNSLSPPLAKVTDPHFRRAGWSDDGGPSFSQQVRDAGPPEPVCEASISLYTLAADAPDGCGRYRVLFSNPGSSRAANRRHLTVRISYDGCRA